MDAASNAQALFLYDNFRSFAMAALKDDQRRHWLQGVFQAEQVNMNLTGVANIDGVNHGQMAAWVWLGRMNQFFELKNVCPTSRLISTSARKLLSSPNSTIKKIAKRFRLPLENSNFDQGEQNLVLQTHAKIPDKSYNPTQLEQDQMKLNAELGSELDEGLACLGDLIDNDGMLAENLCNITTSIGESITLKPAPDK